MSDAPSQQPTTKTEMPLPTTINPVSKEFASITYEATWDSLKKMVSSPDHWKEGYKTLLNYENNSNFYMNLLKISFTSAEENLKKWAGSSFWIFIKKNYVNDSCISNEERLWIVSFMLSNINIDNYYLKYLISKALGYIAAKEFPNCYEGFIKILITNLQKQDITDNAIDTILRILIQVLRECSDACAVITKDVLPVIINIFKQSKNNQKNREKCLIIIYLLWNKLSYADGNDPDLLENSLDHNSLMESAISLFTSILVSNPKMLLDIKKHTIRILDVWVRDMPIYSSKFFNILIEPCWRLIVLESSWYGDTVIFNKQIEYTEEEEITMEEENHEYKRGYESDDDEETYDIEGLILELIDFSIDLLKRNSVIEALRPALYTFLLCVKSYLLIPHNSIILWKNNPNLYISEEYDEENINTVRSKTLGLIREISKEIDDTALIQFLHLIISELTHGVDIENYKEVIKLDDYNLITPYFEKLNNDKQYLQTRQESNLWIIGTLYDEILRLKDKKLLSKEEVDSLIKYLLEIISTPDNNTSILVGRAIWAVSKLLCLVRHDTSLLKWIFEKISKAMCDERSDTSIKLVASQCISSICQRLISSKQEIDSDCIIADYDCWIRLLPNVNEDTIFIPVENWVYLSKLNKEKSWYLPLKHLNPLLKIYAENFTDSYLGTKLLDLIKIWCKDKTSANALWDKFIPIAIKVFEEFYKNIGEKDNAFEQVKNTVMTEHSNPDIKTSVSMLPNWIDIITMLTKTCSESKDLINLKWISWITKALCNILLLSNDVTILQRGSSFLRFYLALCKDIIISENQGQMLIKVLLKYFNPTWLESSMLFIGNVISQYFYHIQNKIVPVWFETIVKRIYKAKMPSIVQSLILVYSRYLVKFPNETLEFLISIQVENRVGLKVLIDKWLLHQPWFRGNYFKNISIKALSTWYQMKNPIVESLMVIGYNPSHSTASIEVNAPCKILSVLIRCLNNEIMKEKVRNEKTNYDDMNRNNDDDDDDDNNEMKDDEDGEGNERPEADDFKDEEEKSNKSNKDNDDKKLDINEDEFKDIQEEPKDFSSKLSFLNNQGKAGGLNNWEQGSEIYLTEMLGFDYNDIEGDEDESAEEDLVFLKDIDFEFVLKDYLIEWFKNLKSNNEEYWMECLKLLPKDDQKLFKGFEI